MRAKVRLMGRLYLFIFVLWGLYRLIFRLPGEVEELFLKPLLWLVPTFYVVYIVEKKGLSSLGFGLKNLLKDISRGLLFSLLFFLIGLSINYIKNNFFSFTEIFLNNNYVFMLLFSLVTAVCEETVFRGYFQNRLEQLTKNKLFSNIIASALFVLIYLPITVFAYHYSLPQIFIFLTLVFLGSFGSGLLFSWTGTVWASIIIHFFWSWPTTIFK